MQVTKQKKLKVYAIFEGDDKLWTIEEINANGPLKAKLIQDHAERIMPNLGYRMVTPRDKYEQMLDDVRKNGYHPEKEKEKV